MAVFNKDTQQMLQGNETLYEAMMLATSDGNEVTKTNPYPVGDYTSKNRLKVSTYQTVFSNTFQYGKETDVWDEVLTLGGTATHNLDTNNIDMVVTSSAGSKVIRQTRNVMRYIPSRSSTLTYAIRLDTPLVGIQRRIGMFDEENGIYFEDSGLIGTDGLPEYNVVVKSSTSGVVVENRVPRTEWNGDRLDGTGESGLIIDFTRQNLINMDYEWYGAGQVMFGFSINGKTHIIHTFNHANVLSLPWSSTPFLPIRVEIENLTGVAGTHVLYQGSNSLISEGTPEKLGISENVSAPFTGTTMTAANTWYPVLSIRLNELFLKGIVLPDSFQLATVDNTNLFFKIVLNSTLPADVTLGANGPQPWLNVPEENSFTQYQTYISPASIIEANHGRSIDSGFVVSGGGGTKTNINDNAAFQLGRNSLGAVSDVLTILVSSSGANKEALASMTWIEQR